MSSFQGTTTVIGIFSLILLVGSESHLDGLKDRQVFASPLPEAVLANRNDLLKFRAVDCPSSTSVEDPELNDLPKNCALVFVIDAQQEPYTEALSLARQYMESTFAKQPDINIHFLIHKVDGDKFFSEEIRSEILRDVRTKLSHELSDTQIGREI
eukprot:3270666-Amphidinium_carterae.1